MSPWPLKKDQEAGTPAWAVASGSGVRVSELLGEETVLIAPPGTDKKGLLEALIARLCGKKGLAEPETLLARVLERERGISTTLDTGVSLPHARLDGLAEIVAAMAVVPQGLADPGQPAMSIRVMFLFFSPNKQEFFPLHLRLLRGVSALFQPTLVEQLVRAKTPPEALEMIRKAEA